MATSDSFTDAELLAYVAEALSLPRSSELEGALRQSSQLQTRLAGLLQQLDHQEFNLSETWRRRRLTCPTRETWAAYLAERIGGEFRSYLEFHLQQVGCRFCQANLEDLRTHYDPAANQRVRKFFETSVGRLRDLPLS